MKPFLYLLVDLYFCCRKVCVSARCSSGGSAFFIHPFCTQGWGVLRIKECSSALTRQFKILSKMGFIVPLACFHRLHPGEQCLSRSTWSVSCSHTRETRAAVEKCHRVSLPNVPSLLSSSSHSLAEDVHSQTLLPIGSRLSNDILLSWNFNQWQKTQNRPFFN